jgi:membrane protease YdiL (CAAX protease family)
MPISVIIFLLLIVVAIPFLSIYNLKMIAVIKDMMMPNKSKMYFQSAMNQLFLTCIALWAADSSEIKLNVIGNFSSLSILGGVVFLALAFTVGYLTNKNKNIEEDNPGLDLLKPNTNKEKISWVLVNFVAASCEEVIFRGVLYQLFLRTTQNIYAAAIMSALCFGFSHSVQGIGGIIITAIFGLGLQQLVNINDGLLIAMLVHFIYNMGTTVMLLNAKKTGINTENL